MVQCTSANRNGLRLFMQTLSDPKSPMMDKDFFYVHVWQGGVMVREIPVSDDKYFSLLKSADSFTMNDVMREDANCLEYDVWKFFGGDRLTKWVNRWAIEVEYDGIRYAMSIGGHAVDFKDITGIDVRFHSLTKEQEVQKMIEYVTVRASQFVDSTGHKLSQILSK